MPEPAPSPLPHPADRGRWVAAFLLLAYTSAVFALSHTPRPPVPELLRGLSDKLLHALEYAPLAFLWGRVLRGSPGRRALLGWAAAGLFGLGDELHQAFVPGREASLLDWGADLLGAAAGAAALAWTLKRGARRKKTAGVP